MEMMDPTGPRPIISKFDGSGRGAAHEMWAKYQLIRPAHEAIDLFSPAGPIHGPWDTVYYCYHDDDIHFAHEAAHVFTGRPRPRLMRWVVLYFSNATGYLVYYNDDNDDNDEDDEDDEDDDDDDDVRTHEATHGLSRSERRAGPCAIFTKKGRRAVYCCCAEVFPEEPKLRPCSR